MSFYQVLTQYPGVVPTVLIGVLLVFWLLAIVGLLDMDDIGPDWLGGSHDGDAAPDVLLALGLDRLPISVVASGIGFFWWLLTALGASLLLPWLPLPAWFGGTLVLLVALAVAVPLAAFSLRSFRPLFVVHDGASQESVIGKTCTILTLSVEEKFGQAEVQMGSGTRLTIQVSAREPNALVRGSTALIIDFDKERRRYHVAEYEAVP